MAIESRVRQNITLFGEWEIDDVPLGRGSNGKTVVFSLKHASGDVEEQCALKAIPLSEEYGAFEDLSANEQEHYGRELFERTQKAKSEIIAMEEMRGSKYIVDYLGHDFDDWSDVEGYGRDLYIRMELLQDLRSEIRHNRSFTEAEIVKIGCDVCRALMLCHSKGIIHRDIKPDNIFFDHTGGYKLGDFGISKSLPDFSHGYAGTGIGTFAYMPAEQLKGRYNKLVDIYSLGLVLYELGNGNRLPFAKSSYATDEDVIQRLSGQSLPMPANIGGKLAKIILKACAFDPKDRYASAEEFLFELERYGKRRISLPRISPRKMMRATKKLLKTLRKIIYLIIILFGLIFFALLISIYFDEDQVENVHYSWGYGEIDIHFRNDFQLYLDLENYPSNEYILSDNKEKELFSLFFVQTENGDFQGIDIHVSNTPDELNTNTYYFSVQGEEEIAEDVQLERCDVSYIDGNFSMTIVLPEDFWCNFSDLTHLVITTYDRNGKELDEQIIELQDYVY